ncbi:hypothetical protein KUTeg_019518 [Tegillarca granosa]|uniref:Uncharacterized protein n=1 Tax=Tegillarca granosa TaxID=220873 RepID=A0ABQ9EGT0_TEGGR|nr:hypothetical protein KUTeg_019518 [Tegillarca granosa]
MISCKRFKGRLTSENTCIWQDYEETVSSYDISEKFKNPKNALSFLLLGFPVSIDETSDDDSEYDPESESENNKTENFDMNIPDNFPNLSHCFAPTLQLVVKDALKHTGNNLKTVIAKAGKINKIIRKSVNASDNLENEKRLQINLQKTGAPHKLSNYERTMLRELCLILKPFEDATIMI